MEKKLRYKVLHGSHTIDKQKYVANTEKDIFSEYPHKVEWMKHRLKLIDDPSEVVDEDKREEVKFKKIHRGAGRYIVVNELTNEPIHDGTMKKDEADEMIQKMSLKSDNTEVGEEKKTAEDEDEEWDEDDN